MLRIHSENYVAMAKRSKKAYDPLTVEISFGVSPKQPLEEEKLDAFRTKYQALASAARAELSRGLQDTGTPEP
jgi:hypothetical protein